MSDDAEEAFDLLRGEVTLLRRAVEGLLADPVKIPPEVSRQLRAQSAELQRLAEETQKIAKSPQLALTPEAFPEYVRRTSVSVTERLEAPWNKTLADLQRVGTEFARYGERARARDVQRRQIVWAVGLSSAVSVAAWLVLSGPLARALPDRWQVAERLAAATLDLDRVQAGQRLIALADPPEWRALELGRELIDLNQGATARCLKRNRPQRGNVDCTLELPKDWIEPVH